MLAFRAHGTLPPQPISQTLFPIFRGSGSETKLYKMYQSDFDFSQQGLQSHRVHLWGTLLKPPGYVIIAYCQLWNPWKLL